VSVILTIVSGQEWAWPWMLGILAALLGGAAGVFTLASVIAVQALAPGGGLTAAWPVKVYATLICIALSAAPTVAVLIVGTATGLTWLDWLAVGIGVVSGIACTVGLGRLAIARLEIRQYAILEQLTAASSPA
jgi:ABC-2 type transport system permease protein